MDETTEAESSCNVGAPPTLLDRLWRALGYRGAYPESPDHWSGYWGMTVTELHVSFADRLRLLISGRAVLRMQQDFEHDPGTVQGVSALEIRRPQSQASTTS